MSLPLSASFTKIVISLLPILAKPPIKAIVNHWSLRRILKIPISTAVADLRPSDAINIAVRCKVPIQVKRNLAQSDGMRIVESPKTINVGLASDVMSFTELDR